MALKTLIISADAGGMRTGDYIRTLFPDLQESAIRKLFSARDVKLDGSPVSRDTALKSGQELKIYLPDKAVPARILRVVYEDEDILLVNKPAGVSVEHDAPGSISLTELCRLYLTESGPCLFPPVPCHRLDHRTCGLIIFAKNSRALEIMQDAFRSRSLDKYYICLVRGMMKPPEAVCSAYLLKDASRSRVRILDHPAPGALPITTGYETVESGAVSRLKVHLITGRTHQIRAHLAAMGHPVLGDDLYGDRMFNKAQKARSLKLCAVSLTMHTGGLLPNLDGRVFSIDPPF